MYLITKSCIYVAQSIPYKGTGHVKFLYIHKIVKDINMYIQIMNVHDIFGMLLIFLGCFT